MKKSTRVIRTITACLLVLTLFCAFCLFMVCADHDCTGEDCRVCHELFLCADLLSHIRYILPALLVCLLAGSHLRSASFFRLRFLLLHISPVSHKVKLSV